MFNNEQKEFMESVDSIDEWVSTIKELQTMIDDDEFISLDIKNDSIIIDSSKVTLNNLSFELNDFTFTDFDKIYEAFCEYSNNKNK